MSTASDSHASAETEWSGNYFNYFTEIEDRFQQARGAGLFLLSPLDWALIESWKNASIPLDAVLKGIDNAFEKWRSRKLKRRFINSLAYCAQAVMEAAERLPSRAAGKTPSSPPFAADELRLHLEKNALSLRQRPESLFQEIASSLEALAAKAADQLQDLEALERRLTALEEKMVAALRALSSDSDLYTMRANLDRELRPYRSKMSAEQISMLERRYLDTALLEAAKLPRLSLFYLH
ncbi:MAG: hypothetical protein JO340_14180 [Acidobacteriaceae bacterium]|nr:hypothetical protein [Acidobacteriaceae bacterium]